MGKTTHSVFSFAAIANHIYLGKRSSTSIRQFFFLANQAPRAHHHEVTIRSECGMRSKVECRINFSYCMNTCIYMKMCIYIYIFQVTIESECGMRSKMEYRTHFPYRLYICVYMKMCIYIYIFQVTIESGCGMRSKVEYRTHLSIYKYMSPMLRISN